MEQVPVKQQRPASLAAIVKPVSYRGSARQCARRARRYAPLCAAVRGGPSRSIADDRGERSGCAPGWNPQGRRACVSSRNTCGRPERVRCTSREAVNAAQLRERTQRTR
jgi:hypothetical protein